MTYCLAIKLEKGIVGIADRRITSGNETMVAKKIYIHNKPHHALFVMTSGLRSVRDKAITYFKEALEDYDETFDKLYKAVNAFARQVKRVAEEDKKALEESGLNFNLFALVGGQLEKDADHKVYLLYPQGNWVEIVPSTPFAIIGSNGFGKPMLVRSLTYASSMEFALKTGFLSFDATRISTNDVSFPIDVITYFKDSYKINEQSFEEHELRDFSEEWNQSLIQSINKMPDNWMDKVFGKNQPFIV